MGFGHNVYLVFNRALNIVQLLEPLLFVNVVQLLFRPKFAKMGCSGKKFAGPPLWRRNPQKHKIRTVVARNHFHLLRGGSLLGEHLEANFRRNAPDWPKVSQNKVIWGLIRPQEALLLFRELNVKPLLFKDPTVVLLLLLTIRTVFSA